MKVQSQVRLRTLTIYNRYLEDLDNNATNVCVVDRAKLDFIDLLEQSKPEECQYAFSILKFECEPLYHILQPIILEYNTFGLEHITDYQSVSENSTDDSSSELCEDLSIRDSLISVWHAICRRFSRR